MIPVSLENCGVFLPGGGQTNSVRAWSSNPCLDALALRTIFPKTLGGWGGVLFSIFSTPPKTRSKGNTGNWEVVQERAMPKVSVEGPGSLAQLQNKTKIS